MPRILVIDDDKDVNDMVLCMLAGAGYEAEGVVDGKFGLKILERKCYDLIITDIIMPDKEGLETILSIRKTNKTLPIIAMSGGGRIGPENYLQMAQMFGANYTFQKPFSTAAFLAAVRKCLDKSGPVSLSVAQRGRPQKSRSSLLVRSPTGSI